MAYQTVSIPLTLSDL